MRESCVALGWRGFDFGRRARADHECTGLGGVGLRRRFVKILLRCNIGDSESRVYPRSELIFWHTDVTQG